METKTFSMIHGLIGNGSYKIQLNSGENMNYQNFWDAA